MFAIFVGVALVAGGERYRSVLQVMQEFLDLLLRIIGWIMWLAPLGILALLIRLVAEQDVALLVTMLGFIVLVFGTTLFHGMVTLPSILYAVTRKSPLWFWRGAREAIITAFATSSSSAALPISLRCAQDNLGVKRPIAGFVLPLGATMNMDGTALYEAAAALFVANLIGVELSLAQQLVVFLTAMIASSGAPGIPSAGMVTRRWDCQRRRLPSCYPSIACLIPCVRRSTWKGISSAVWWFRSSPRMRWSRGRRLPERPLPQLLMRERPARARFLRKVSRSCGS